jgi:acyl dehydratase
MVVRQQTTLPPLTRVQIARYAGAVRDFNPIHLDDEYARAAGLPSAVAHGPLTLARAIDVLVSEVGPASVKSLRARFKAPYTPGEPLVVVPVDGGMELRNGSDVVLATLTIDLVSGADGDDEGRPPS